MTDSASRQQSATEEMSATFAEADLPQPPIPQVLASALRSQGRWCWGTRPVEPDAMYLFRRYPDEVIYGSNTDNYVAVSHAGHGVNSYFLTYQLVLGRLAVMTQVGWGGAYMDADRARAKITRVFSEVEALLVAAAPLAEARIGTGPPLVVLASDRPLGATGWLLAPCSDEKNRAEWLLSHRCDPRVAFTRANGVARDRV